MDSPHIKSKAKKQSAHRQKPPRGTAAKPEPKPQAPTPPEEIIELPKRPYRTHGGVHPAHMKHTADMPSEEMPIPPRVVISMQQHIGAACQPLVKAGDSVTVGQKIADNDSPVCAPIHSGVSGKVKAIGTMLLPNGAEVPTIEIETDGRQTVCEDVKPPDIHNLDELYAAVRESGLVGLGGAGFPASIKLNYSTRTVDTLLINGAECEPYLTADCREMLETPEDIIEGAAFLLEMLQLKRVIIGVEGNKPEAIAKLRETIAAHELSDKVCVLKLKASYPQGAEKVLVKACTNRAVPIGHIPADVGCIVLNITSAAFLARYVRTGMPLIAKRITVDGSAIAEPKNVIAPIGTLISDIAEFCGGFKETPRKVLMGGPMMGTALYTLDYPIIKQNNGLIFMTAEEARSLQPTDCIRCGRCVSACPMYLTPVSIQHLVQKRDIKGINDINVQGCMECGCCAYACPAHRPLVQFLRTAKQLCRE